MHFSTVGWPVVVAFVGLAHVAIASSTGWAADGGTQLVYQNEQSSGLSYNDCHNSSPDMWISEHPNRLPVEIEPRKDTPLASVGWTEANTTWTNLFYVDPDGNVVSARYSCVADLGKLNLRSSTSLERELPDSMPADPRTGLASVLLGAHRDVRVFYIGTDEMIHQMSFLEGRGWLYHGPVVNETVPRSALAVASTHRSEDITLITPKDSSSVWTIQARRDSDWEMTTYPTTEKGGFLPHWDINSESLVMFIDESGIRNFFYIGLDNQLRHVKDNTYKWIVQPLQDDLRWPKAATDHRDLTIASRHGSNDFKLYYHDALGHFVEVAYTVGAWQDHRVLSTNGRDSSTPTAAASEPSPSESKPSRSGGFSSLTDGQLAAVIIIVSLSGVVFLALVMKRKTWMGRQQPVLGAENIELQNRNPAAVRSQRRPPLPPRPEGFRHVRIYASSGPPVGSNSISVTVEDEETPPPPYEAREGDNERRQE